jgi:hypothetical protein
MKYAYKSVVGKIKVKRPLEKCRRKWDYDIKNDLKGTAGLWNGLICLNTRKSGSPCKNGKKRSGV